MYTLDFKRQYDDKLENIMAYNNCVTEKIRKNIADAGIITVHDFIMLVGSGKVKVQGVGETGCKTIIQYILEYLNIMYNDDSDKISKGYEMDAWLKRYQTYHYANS